MTDKQLGDILHNMTIVVDTREKKNDHIIEYLMENNIKFKIEKLDFGDYACELPEPYNVLNSKIVVEKKNSLDEINGNFTTNRDRFHNEFQRAKNNNSKIHLLVENTTWKKINNGSYRSSISPASVTASILDFNARYDCPVWFVEKQNSPHLMYNILKYGTRRLLKENY